MTSSEIPKYGDRNHKRNDVQALCHYVVKVLQWKHVDEIELSDVEVAESLGFDLDRLHHLQRLLKFATPMTVKRDSSGWKTTYFYKEQTGDAELVFRHVYGAMTESGRTFVTLDQKEISKRLKLTPERLQLAHDEIDRTSCVQVVYFDDPNAALVKYRLRSVTSESVAA